MKDKWKLQWNEASNSHLVVDTNKKVNGFMMLRKGWVTLNRFRTDVGKCWSCLWEENFDEATYF